MSGPMMAPQNTGIAYAPPRPLMRDGYLVRSARAVAFLRLVDLGSRFLGPWSRRKVRVPARPRRILVANWAHLGDMLLSLPTLAALRRQFPDAEIDLLASRSGHLAAKGTGLFDRVHLVEHFMLNRSGAGWLSRLSGYLADRRRFIVAVRARRYDVAIDLYSNFPPASPLFWRCGIPVRCGFTSGGFGPLLTHPVSWHYQDKPISRYGRDLLAALWPLETQESAAFRPCYPGQPRLARGDIGMANAPGYIVLHPGSGASAREWPEEKWRELVRVLTTRSCRLVLCGTGAREGARVDRLAACADASLVDTFLDRSWDEFVALVAGARCVICLESSAAHLAAAFRVPTVAIFTGTNEHRLWGPDNAHARVISAPTACAPCHRTGCDAMACVRHVTVAMVLDRLDELLPASRL